MEILSQIIQDTVLNFQQFPYKFKCPKGMSTKEPTYLWCPRHCAGAVKRKKCPGHHIQEDNYHWKHRVNGKKGRTGIKSQEEREATVLG